MDTIEELLTKFKHIKSELIKANTQRAGDNEQVGQSGIKRGIFSVSHVHNALSANSHEEAKNAAKAAVNESSASDENKKKASAMINSSKNQRHLAQGISNFMLAHPSEGLRVVKADRDLRDDVHSEEKGVHLSYNPNNPGRSVMGILSGLGAKEEALQEAKNNLKQLKGLKKPKLVKSEQLTFSSNGQWSLSES
jgi:hypothetical protein